MATVTHSKLASGFLKAGASSHRKRNNAPAKNGWFFSVEPASVPDDEILLGDHQVEITRVYHVFHPDGEREIHVIVKNTGEQDCGFDLYITQITP